MAITSANQLELLQTAEAVAREKMIDPDLVIEAMEDSLAHAARNACNKNGNHITKILKNIETLKKSGKLSFLLFCQWNQRKTYAGLYISPHRQSRLDRNRIGIQSH